MPLLSLTNGKIVLGGRALTKSLTGSVPDDFRCSSTAEARYPSAFSAHQHSCAGGTRCLAAVSALVTIRLSPVISSLSTV